MQNQVDYDNSDNEETPKHTLEMDTSKVNVPRLSVALTLDENFSMRSSISTTVIEKSWIAQFEIQNEL